MEIASLGNNHMTVCACCDRLIVVKNKDVRAGSDEVSAQLTAHISGSRKCKAYYDALPTFSDMQGIVPKTDRRSESKPTQKVIYSPETTYDGPETSYGSCSICLKPFDGHGTCGCKKR